MIALSKGLCWSADQTLGLGSQPLIDALPAGGRLGRSQSSDASHLGLDGLDRLESGTSAACCSSIRSQSADRGRWRGVENKMARGHAVASAGSAKSVLAEDSRWRRKELQGAR